MVNKILDFKNDGSDYLIEPDLFARILASVLGSMIREHECNNHDVLVHAMNTLRTVQKLMKQHDLAYEVSPILSEFSPCRTLDAIRMQSIDSMVASLILSYK